MMNSLVYKVAQILRSMGVSFHEENDPRVKAMREEMRRIGGVQFDIEVLGDGTWVAESKNIDGIITGGTDRQSINETLKDAIFTYFEIPPQLCNDALIKAPNEPLRMEQKVYA